MNPVNPAPVTAPHYGMKPHAYMPSRKDPAICGCCGRAESHELHPPAHGVTGLNVAQSIPIEELLRRYNTQTWQPIETAPRDGSRVLLWSETELEIGYWSTCCWVPVGGAWIIYEARSDTIELTPTHWMPLPEPPTALASARPGVAQPECGVAGIVVDGVKLP